jgi:hypothetical protein
MMLKTGAAPFCFFDTSFKEVGSKYHQQYAVGQPVPHIVLDDFLPEEFADLCLTEFPQRSDRNTVFARSQENQKYQFDVETLSPAVRALFHSFNSAPFIGFLEQLTGINGLIPDPYFSGGAGLHEIANGGHMNIHVDFNHHAQMDLEHRLNVLIYLNRDWKEEYGGCFELWDSAMSQCKLRVVPLFNRCVIFNSSATSFHGNPEPIKHPLGASRRSLALYYYTATWDGSRAKRLSQFKARPHSADQFDVRNRLYEFANDLTPPIARRALTRLLNGYRRALIKNPEH